MDMPPFPYYYFFISLQMNAYMAALSLALSKHFVSTSSCKSTQRMGHLHEKKNTHTLRTPHLLSVDYFLRKPFLYKYFLFEIFFLNLQI